MQLEKLCSIEFTTHLDSHHPKPYGNESGPGWAVGDGVVLGERLNGTMKWSNHSYTRSDGLNSPGCRGLITTDDGSKVMFDLTGRFLWLPPKDGNVLGRHLLMALFESDAEGYAWLNNEVCIAEGIADPQNPPSRLVVHLCKNDLV